MPAVSKNVPKAPSKPKPSLRGAPPVTMNLSIQGPGLLPDGDGDGVGGKVPKVVIKTELEKLLLTLQKAKPSLLGDQRRRLVSSMGCISNPGGPGC